MYQEPYEEITPVKPALMHIPMSRLHLAFATGEAPGYQRAANMDRVRKIAREWDWVQLNALTVSRRVGVPFPGRLFVVDRHHRLLAARLLFDPDQGLPCQVSPMDYKREAWVFANQNRNSAAPAR